MSIDIDTFLEYERLAGQKEGYEEAVSDILKMLEYKVKSYTEIRKYGAALALDVVIHDIKNAYLKGYQKDESVDSIPDVQST